MNELPSIWRTELFHPLVIHFPIVLLSVGAIGWIAGQAIGSRKRLDWLIPGARILLWIGMITAWVAIYTGSLADAEVARTLCDPTVVEQHEEMAYRVGYLFTGAVLMEGVSAYLQLEDRRNLILKGVVGLALIAGTSTLFYVGHLGAKLVYQQGAGVHQPSEDCVKFE